MEPTETILISGRVLAEFEEDASQFLSHTPEFVGTPTTTHVPPSLPNVPPLNEVVQGKPS